MPATEFANLPLSGDSLTMEKPILLRAVIYFYMIKSIFPMNSF
jgi:hypothetical protein